eukprot:CAMPEP_0201604564 /NCGR_PEP_ID=MMETSP0492-20130828/4664_1 /ASSEMBLY_ACC=CAM_ASM_000837 /TAXON_ID=420259 /ORGANISM="Thalassiosira gravida, Strain GMp14c1" /LENGTH=317 /DNA_ID=CAMNT_0048068625 /DNA_START=189 /DNA_END=1142 /DNA_ORIENTATION=+
MAGHNKWSKIRHKKTANDVSRSKQHAKAARAIEAASLACQGDLTDLALQSKLSAARSVRLPKERLRNAIERGANPRDARNNEGEYLVRRYDGMIPTDGDHGGKVAVIVETLTENRNRTAGNVRHLVTKVGGELLPTGANEWLFEHVGLIWVKRRRRCRRAVEDNGSVDDDDDVVVADDDSVEVDTMDALLECALEGGATDVEFGLEEGSEPSANADSNDDDDDDDDDETDHHYDVIKCETNNLLHLVQTLNENGYETTQFENRWLVKDENNKVPLSDKESEEKLDKFLSSMEDDLDVTNVFHNATFVGGDDDGDDST